MISVGLVGAGPWADVARYAHARGCAESPAERDLGPPARGRALGWPQRFTTVAVGSFEELLDRCDAVAFAVPPNVQAALAPVAAHAGKHLLLEKPLAFTVAEAERIAHASDEAGVITQLLLTYRFTQSVRDFLATAQESTVRQVRAGWISDVVGSPFATPWRLALGAALLDVGPHAALLTCCVRDRRPPSSGCWQPGLGGVTAITTTHRGGAIGQSALVTTPARPDRLRLRSSPMPAAPPSPTRRRTNRTW